MGTGRIFLIIVSSLYRPIREPHRTINRTNNNNIYLTKFCKVLVGVIIRVIIVFNFHIYKELFGLISLIFKIFYPFVLNQEALEIEIGRAHV